MLRSFRLVGGVDVRHLADGDVGGGVDVMDDLLHPRHLKAVDDEIHHRLGGVGIAAAGLQAGGAALERLGQRVAHLGGLDGDDDGAFGSVQTLHHKVDGLDAGGVGHDGIEGQYPIPHHTAAHDVQHQIVRQFSLPQHCAQHCGALSLCVHAFSSPV